MKLGQGVTHPSIHPSIHPPVLALLFGSIVCDVHMHSNIQEQATPDKSKLTVLPILSNGTPPMLEPSPPMLAPPMLLGLAFDFCLGAAEY